MKTMNLIALGAMIVAGMSAKAASEVTVETLSCAAINKAIRALPEEGGAVRLVKGTYECTEPVAIERDNVSLIGAGRNETILLSSKDVHIPVLVIGMMKTPDQPGHLPKYANDPVHTGAQFYPLKEVNNITVTDLTVDGNRLNKAQQAQGQFECYVPAGEQARNPETNQMVDGPTAIRCDGDGGKWVRVNAITVRRASDVRLLRTAARGAESGGLTVEKGSTRLLVDDFEASQNIFDGFAGYETDASVFRNMNLHDNTSSGISIDFNFNNNTFENLKLVKNNDNGVFSHSVMGNKYINVVLKQNKNFGFWIDGWRNRDENWPSGDFKNARTAGCDGTEIHNVRSIDPLNDVIRMNYPCRGVVIENVKVKRVTKPEVKDCVIRDGSDVNVIGPNPITCEVKLD